MLWTYLTYPMATENSKQGNQIKSGNYEEYYRNHVGKKIEPVWSYLSNGKHPTGEKRCIWYSLMEWTSRRDRPNQEWLDDIKEWYQEDIHTLSRKAQDRDLWRRTVSYAVPYTAHVSKCMVRTAWGTDVKVIEWLIMLDFLKHYLFIALNVNNWSQLC